MDEAQAWEDYGKWLDTLTTARLIAEFQNTQGHEEYEVGGTLVLRAKAGDLEAKAWIKAGDNCRVPETPCLQAHCPNCRMARIQRALDNGPEPEDIEDLPF